MNLKENNPFDVEFDEIYEHGINLLDSDKSDQDEWFEDDCHERTRDMREELK